MLTVAKIVLSVVLQHGMMIKPTSRNAIDRTLPAFYVSKHMRAQTLSSLLSSSPLLLLQKKGCISA